MSEFRDLSKLPADEKYWESLEARILADVGSRAGRATAIGSGWWSPLAARAWSLGGLAAAAALAALLLTPGRSAPAAGLGLLSLPEGDPVLHTLVSAPAPPSLASLMLPNPRSAP